MKRRVYKKYNNAFIAEKRVSGRYAHTLAAYAESAGITSLYYFQDGWKFNPSRHYVPGFTEEGWYAFWRVTS